MKNIVSIKRQQGVGLIEVLVAMVILALCMLGMAALQTVSLRDNQSAQSRSMATMMSASIVDAMRANRTAARNGDYNVSSCDATPSGTLAGADIAAWQTALRTAIGPSACGGISCTNAGQCDITVRWDDSRGTDGNSAYTITTRAQL